MMKALPWVLFALALVGAVVAFGLLLNAGSALDSARSQATHLRARGEVALTIIRKQWIGRDAAEVVELVAEMDQQGVIAKRGTDGSFEIGDFVFETKDGVVTHVRYFD
jgi:hypothetical protein